MGCARTSPRGLATAAVAGAALLGACTPGTGAGRDRPVYTSLVDANAPAPPKTGETLKPGDAIPGKGVDKTDLERVNVGSTFVGGTPRTPEDDKRSRRRVEAEKEEDEFYADKVEEARAAIDRGDDEMAA